MSDPIRKPRSVNEATPLAERYAVLDSQISEIEADRKASIAAVNARCDTAANDLIGQRDAIAGKIAAWWPDAKDGLLEGDRKSVELGGCMIGSRKARATLAIAGEEQDVIDLLTGLRWAKPFLKIRTTLDKVAILKGIDGKRGPAFAELGLSRNEGEDTFYIERTGQEGTRS